MTATIEGNELVIRVQLDESDRLSSTGRSYIRATTAGWKEIESGNRRLKVSMTVIEPLRKRDGQRPAEEYYE